MEAGPAPASCRTDGFPAGGITDGFSWTPDPMSAAGQRHDARPDPMPFRGMHAGGKKTHPAAGQRIRRTIPANPKAVLPIVRIGSL